MKILVAALLCISGICASGVAAKEFSAAGPDGPAQTAYPPEKGPAPVVMLLSGASGPNNYHASAAEIAKAGFYAVLLDGNDILRRQQEVGLANLQKAIERAQRSPHAMPGKVAVIGYSMGGGGAIVHAATLPDLVTTVVAYYPSTSFVPNAGVLARRFKVPVLVLAGERDDYRNCCLIGSMRDMEKAAKELNLPFQLVVYPDGKHGFNIDGSNYRRDYEQDALKRTLEALRSSLPAKTP
jgi:dienelactone hydrolase